MSKRTLHNLKKYREINENTAVLKKYL